MGWLGVSFFQWAVGSCLGHDGRVTLCTVWVASSLLSFVTEMFVKVSFFLLPLFVVIVVVNAFSLPAEVSPLATLYSLLFTRHTPPSQRVLASVCPAEIFMRHLVK